MTTPAATTTPPRFTASTLGARIVALAVIALAIIWRFSPWIPSVFYGDDLFYLLSFMDGTCGTRLSGILTTVCYERFRPVASGVVLTMMELFGTHLPYYQTVNIFLQGIVAALAFAISMRLSRSNWIVSLAIALVVATSRFAAYAVTQVIGPVESLPLALTLGMVYAVVRAEQGKSPWRWCWLAIGLCFLATNSHERFMVMAMWLGVAFAVSPRIRSLSRGRWIILLLGCIAIPVAYISYKTFVLDAYFLIGTEGTHLGFSFPLILE
ncbi:MAG: hypothetical protein ACTS5I_17295, partial [Rhodanobacter sp.]